MPSEQPNELQHSARRDLSELRNFAGPPKEFWPRYVSGLAGLTAASKVVVLFHDRAHSGAWKRVAEWPPNLAPSRFLQAFHSQLEDLAARGANSAAGLLAPPEPGAARPSSHYVVASRLRLYRTRPPPV